MLALFSIFDNKQIPKTTIAFKILVLRWPVCRIERIGFFLSGDSEYSNWDDYPDRFANIICAFSKCKLKLSIKKIEVFGCGDMNEEKAGEVLEEYGMEHVQVDDKY